MATLEFMKKMIKPVPQPKKHALSMKSSDGKIISEEEIDLCK